MTVERLIAPRRRSIGATEVDRLLPFHARRMVGPFIFADLIGPEELAPGRGADVPPHPHIGLATVTYLFDGTMVHRDSTGAVQAIEPGGVNWMTAGSGVAHSERSPDDARAGGLAARRAADVGRPAGRGQSRAVVPARGGGRSARRSEAACPSACSSAKLRDGVSGARRLAVVPCRRAARRRHPVALPAEHEERAVLVIDGDVEVDGEPIAPRHLAVVEPGDAVVRAASRPG